MLIHLFLVCNCTLWHSQTYTGHTRPPILSRVITSSAMGLQLRYSNICTTHMKTNFNKMCPQLLRTCVRLYRVPCGFLQVFIFTLRSQQIQVTYAHEKSGLFRSPERPKYPKLESHVGRKIAPILESSGLNLWWD